MELEFNNQTGINTNGLEDAFYKLNQDLELDLDRLTVHFLNDEEVLEINKSYLRHDYYTDIITFDLRDEDSSEAELYISTDRTLDNANALGIPEHVELWRVCIHGMLHLGGFSDKSEKEMREMREQENKYLTLLFHVKHETK